MTAFCALLLLAAAESTRVGSIDFFGYGGLDLEQVRASLPIRVGGTLSEHAREEVKKAVGQAATVSFICCNQRGDWLVYIGLAGKTAHAVRYNPAPTGDARLPKPGLEVYDRAMELLFEAARRHAEDDNSHGYAISAYQPLKTVQIAMREYAKRHPRELLHVLASAADERQRIAAAHLLGYADESDEQIAALATASHDTSEHVRNNAVRALAVLADHDPATARKIPAAPFIDLLSSITWSDRNKALWLLSTITATRDAETLARVRREALEPLIEMAQWPSGHAFNARLLLGRIAGIEETRLQQLAAADDPAPILKAVRTAP